MELESKCTALQSRRRFVLEMQMLIVVSERLGCGAGSGEPQLSIEERLAKLECKWTGLTAAKHAIISHCLRLRKDYG